MDLQDHHNAYTFLPYLPASPSPNSPNPPPFKVSQTSTWTYCGPLLSPSRLPPSLHNWSTAALSSPSALLQRLLPLLTFLEAYLKAAGVQHYWLTLRATRPTQEYDIPRWHVDDDFFATPGSRRGALDGKKAKTESKSESGSERHGKSKSKSRSRSRSRSSSKRKTTKQHGKGGWKLCTTLLGPSTLFLQQPWNKTALCTLRATKAREAAKRNHICTSIRCAGCGDTGDAVRRSLASAFALEPVVQSSYGSVAVFRTGEDEGAVHSEPACGEDRVFVNVVPGTEGELRALMGRFGMEFPRAWSLGLLMCGEDACVEEGPGQGKTVGDVEKV